MPCVNQWGRMGKSQGTVTWNYPVTEAQCAGCDFCLKSPENLWRGSWLVRALQDSSSAFRRSSAQPPARACFWASWHLPSTPGKLLLLKHLSTSAAGAAPKILSPPKSGAGAQAGGTREVPVSTACLAGAPHWCAWPGWGMDAHLPLHHPPSHSRFRINLVPSVMAWSCASPPPARPSTRSGPCSASGQSHARFKREGVKPCFSTGDELQ